MRLRFLVSLAMLAGLVAAVGQSPVQAAQTMTCYGSVDDQGRVSIQLPQATQLSPRGFVVERSRDGGQFWWRGRGSGEIFVDTMPSGSHYEYRIRSTAPDPAIGFCGIADLTGNQPVPQVELCNIPTQSFGPDDINLTVYAEANYRHLQKKWVFYRSVNGGPLYWRAAQTGAWLGGFPILRDEVKLGQSVEYFVVSVDPDGRRSEPFSCGTFNHQTLDPVPATFCGQNADNNIFDPLPRIRIESTRWTSGVAVYRSIDGGPAYWRGRAELGFFQDAWYWEDETLVENDDRKFEYWIEQVGYNGRRGERIYCGEIVFPLNDWP